MVNIAVIGFGYWGPNITRNFALLDTCKVKTIADPDSSRLLFANKLYPHIRTTQNTDEILDDPEIDAVVIATPIATHSGLAKKALIKGKHVFIEKPMATSLEEALELKKISEEKNLKVLVDHIYLYNDATRKIKDLISSGTIGKIRYFDSIRVSLGLFNNDSNVLWDLAVHDLSIMNYLIDETPSSVIATGISHTGNNIENIAYVTLNYNTGLISHINCSWTSPVKIRQILIGGTEKMILFNDLEPTEKIKIYDTKYNVFEREKMMVEYRIGEINIPYFDRTEALHFAANDFISAIVNDNPVFSGSDSGIAVLKILEAAQKSLKENGKEVFIDGNS